MGLYLFLVPDRRSTPGRERSVSRGRDAGKHDGTGGGGPRDWETLRAPGPVPGSIPTSGPSGSQTPAQTPTHGRPCAGSTWAALRVRRAHAFPGPAFRRGGAGEGEEERLREHVSFFCIGPFPNGKVGPARRDRATEGFSKNPEFRCGSEALNKALQRQCAGALCVSRDFRLPGNRPPALPVALSGEHCTAVRLRSHLTPLFSNPISTFQCLLV